MGNRIEINLLAEGLVGEWKKDFQLGGQGRYLSGKKKIKQRTAEAAAICKIFEIFAMNRREEYSPTPPKGKELSVKCMITSLTVTAPLAVPSIICLTS